MTSRQSKKVYKLASMALRLWGGSPSDYKKVIEVLEKDAERQYAEWTEDEAKALRRQKADPDLKVPIPRQPPSIKRIREACSILSTRPAQKTLDDWLLRLEDLIIEEDRAAELKKGKR